MLDSDVVGITELRIVQPLIMHALSDTLRDLSDMLGALSDTQFVALAIIAQSLITALKFIMSGPADKSGGIVILWTAVMIVVITMAGVITGVIGMGGGAAGGLLWLLAYMQGPIRSGLRAGLFTCAPMGPLSISTAINSAPAVRVARQKALMAMAGGTRPAWKIATLIIPSGSLRAHSGAIMAV